jgi:hypothetical protein
MFQMTPFQNSTPGLTMGEGYTMTMVFYLSLSPHFFFFCPGHIATSLFSFFHLHITLSAICPPLTVSLKISAISSVGLIADKCFLIKLYKLRNGPVTQKRAIQKTYYPSAMCGLSLDSSLNKTDDTVVVFIFQIIKDILKN